MADLLELPYALAQWGLTPVIVPGWQDRKRPGVFAPIGVLVHHTAAPDRSKDAPSLQVCIDGRRDLPGPLCQLLVARSGKVYVISRGRCNHAGEGFVGPIGRDKGNTLLLGIEAENDGVGEPWPAVQVGAMVKATAAVLDLLGRPRTNVWGHREYTPRKIDPAGITMAQFRADVAAARPPGGPVPTDNPYPAATAEALDLLAEHAGYTDPDRKWFGPLALQALHQLKNDKLAAEADFLMAQGEATTLRKANATSADTIKRLTVERNLAEAEATDIGAVLAATKAARDTAVANREAAEAEVAMLRKQLQEGGRIGQLLADLDAAIAKARA